MATEHAHKLRVAGQCGYVLLYATASVVELGAALRVLRVLAQELFIQLEVNVPLALTKDVFPPTLLSIIAIFSLRLATFYNIPLPSILSHASCLASPPQEELPCVNTCGKEQREPHGVLESTCILAPISPFNCPETTKDEAPKDTLKCATSSADKFPFMSAKTAEEMHALLFPDAESHKVDPETMFKLMAYPGAGPESREEMHKILWESKSQETQICAISASDATTETSVPIEKETTNHDVDVEELTESRAQLKFPRASSMEEAEYVLVQSLFHDTTAAAKPTTEKRAMLTNATRAGNLARLLTPASSALGNGIGLLGLYNAALQEKYANNAAAWVKSKNEEVFSKRLSLKRPKDISDSPLSDVTE